MYTVSFKSNNSLIDKLIKMNIVKHLELKSFFGKIFSKKEFADIYFHSGAFDEDSLKNIKNAKLVIVNSQLSKDELVIDHNIDKSKIEVLYPSIDIEYKKPKEIKKQFCEKNSLDIKRKIIFFTANNLKASGVKEFLDLMISLNFQDIYIVIAGQKQQVNNLKFQITKYNFADKLILLEDYQDIDELYLSSDLFILPTYNKNFASSVLKAMYCKCAVFTTSNNSASEVIDVFSTMEHPSDRSMQFKVDALLQNKDDLKLIKKQNRKIAKEYTLEKNFDKIIKILENL